MYESNILEIVASYIERDQRVFNEAQAFKEETEEENAADGFFSVVSKKVKITNFIAKKDKVLNSII